MTTPPSATSQAAAPQDPAGRWGFLEWFAIAQIALPALLYLPGTQPFRVLIRVAPFLLSLLPLTRFVPQAAKGMTYARHPAHAWLLWAMTYLVLMIFHPSTNTLTAGFAQTCLYLAVLAPIFWAPAMVKSPQQLQRILTILLYCNGANSIVGVLQVHYPDTWMPRELSGVILSGDPNMLTYIGPDGRRILRPPGLSDNPGAVAGSGMFVALLGGIFFIAPKVLWQKALAALLAGAGITVIYLTQVRTAILIVGGMGAIYVLRLLFTRWRFRALAFIALVFLLDMFSFSMAKRLGGESISERFRSIFSDDPIQSYYGAGRGNQMEHYLTTYLPEHPLGSGLARFGMMRYYFGDESNPDSPHVWTDLQVPGWIIEGGAILLVLYFGALLATSWHDWRKTPLIQDRDVQFWAYSAFALNTGVVALVFGYTPFHTQIGLQYWFLAGVLEGTRRLSR